MKHRRIAMIFTALAVLGVAAAMSVSAQATIYCGYSWC